MDLIQRMPIICMRFIQINRVDVPICYNRNKGHVDIGACRPGHTGALPGLFQIIAYSYHEDRTRRHVVTSI